jgi:hypothetical protein
MSSSKQSIPAAATMPARFADLLPKAGPHAAASFGPLPATVDTDLPDLQTLAPTTVTESEVSSGSADAEQPSANASSEDVDETSARGSAPSGGEIILDAEDLSSTTKRDLEQAGADHDSQERMLRHRAFGLLAMSPHDLGGPMGRRALLTKTQAMQTLQGFGLHADTKPGMHRLADGGAVLVKEDRGFFVEKVDAHCVHALRQHHTEALEEFLAAMKRLRETQDIKTLRQAVHAIHGVETSATVCLLSSAFRERLRLLREACTEWGKARSKVAKLVHHQRMASEHLAHAKKEAAALHASLQQGHDAIHRASAHERRVAKEKGHFILGLLEEASHQITQAHWMQTSVTSPAK